MRRARTRRNSGGGVCHFDRGKFFLCRIKLSRWRSKAEAYAKAEEQGGCAGEGARRLHRRRSKADAQAEEQSKDIRGGAKQGAKHGFERDRPRPLA